MPFTRWWILLFAVGILGATHARADPALRPFSSKRRLLSGVRTDPFTRKVVPPGEIIAAPAWMRVRGGGDGEAPLLELGRQSYKLQAMASYSTITALVMNASLRLYTSQKFTKNPKTGGPSWREQLFTGLTVLCIACGMFTAALFNILGIYAKEALGISCDAGYLGFKAATAVHRMWGFRTFLATCLSFVGSFLLSVMERIYANRVSEEDRSGRAIMVMACLLTLKGLYYIKGVLDLATKYVYTPENC